MSLESAKAFIERMKTDEDFRKKVTECKDNEARRECVKNAGYEFTVEDLKQSDVYLAEVEDNLSANIVGGVQGCTYLWGVWTA
jgi:predicted ribosomally synthesized peptide with nif11-like leader